MSKECAITRPSSNIGIGSSDQPVPAWARLNTAAILRGSGENKLALCEFTANFEALLIYTSIDDLLSASVADGFLYHQVEDSNPSEDDSSGISGNKFTPILFMFWSVPSEYLGPLVEQSTGHASVSLHLACEGTVLERL